MIKRIAYSFAAQNNPYKILGINKGATMNDIKMAYYKLAQQFHPDKNTAKDAAKQFNSINQAYEILSDENKRKMYDTCGLHQEDEDEDFEQEFSQKMNQNQRKKKSNKQYYSKFFSGDYESIFNEFDQFFQQKHGKRKSYYSKKKGEDVKLKVSLSFRDSLFGASKTMIYQRLKTCDSCKGTRAAHNCEPQKCYSCGGSGWLTYVDSGSHMDVKCTNCDGWGKVVKDPCKKCHGEGCIDFSQEKQIDLPRGVQNGSVIRLGGAGSASKTGGQCGDLLIEVQVSEDDRLRRDGNNIISDIPLSVSEMVLGCKKQIQTIWGELTINIPASQQPWTKLQIPQYGIQYGQSNWKKGDHIVVLQLQIPRELNENQRMVYSELQKH